MSKDFFKFRESLLNEDIRKISHSRLKFHATKNVPHGSYSRSEIEDEHERRKRTDGAEYAKAKATMNEEVELDEADTMYVIKHKKTKQVLNTHSDYNTAKDEHEGLGKDKHEYGVYKQTKKDAALRNRNTYREEVELDEVSDKKLDAYRQKAFADQPAGDDGSDKYRKRKFGRDLAFAKQTGRAKVLATKEAVELGEKYKDPWAAPRKGSSAWHAAQQRKKAERDPEEVKRVNAIGNKNHMVGTAKVTRNEEVELDEKAPKLKDDFLKKERERNRAHDAAMGRTPTGRKKTMTSTQKSLASMRKEEVELDEAIDYDKMTTAELKAAAVAAIKRGDRNAVKAITTAANKKIANKGGTPVTKLTTDPKKLDALKKQLHGIKNEEVELGEKKYTAPTQKEIDADRKKDQKGKPRPSMSAKSVTRKTYGNMMGGLKNEQVEQLDELSPNKLHAYIKGASKDLAKRSRMSGYDDKRGNYADGDKNRKRANKRIAGITGASGRLADKANMSEEYVNEKLKVSHGMGAWVDDFKKSDAPQFKGKSDKERRDMAVAAYLSAKRGQKEEYASDAQRKAVWASRAEKGKK